MRVLIFCFILFRSLCALGYNINPNVEKALQYLQTGDTQSAVESFKRASATNDVLGQYYLAQCYEFGIGVSKQLSTAFMMYRRAAERGFPPAMCDMSRCYKNGIGVSMDNVRSNEWQRRYVEKNFTHKFPNIVELYYCSNKKTVKKENEDESPVEKSNKGVLHNEEVHIRQSQSSNDTKPQYVNSNERLVSLENDKAYAESDVDTNIPFSSKTAENTFALIIANENYHDVANVPNALNDGRIMAEYCKKTLGIPGSNIHLVKDATLNNIKREINLMRQIALAYNGQASFLVYYAGHGIPDEKTNQAYMMPIDGYNSDYTTCYCLSDFYDAFGSVPTQKSIIMIDACFSGSTRGDEMLYSARAVRIKAKPSTPIGNTIVFSSAQGDETAYPYNEQKHGLFTYFILKKLKESNGEVALGDLFDYVNENVKKKSLIINGKLQTPTLIPARGIENNWYDWKLN